MRWGAFIQVGGVALLSFSGGMCFVSSGAEPTYRSDYAAIILVGQDLYRMLDSKYRQRMTPQPVRLETDSMPRVFAQESVFPDDPTPRRLVVISSGFVDLINYVAHARAINNLEPGFFDRYVLALARETGEKQLAPLPQPGNRRYWTDAMMNEQLSNFNQMVGMVVAMELAHHYLGHYRKYADRLVDGAGNRVPLGSLITPAEWELALKAAAEDSLNAGFGVDGVIALYNCFERMPQRPAWTAYFLPYHANVAKVRRTLERFERGYFGGFRK